MKKLFVPILKTKRASEKNALKAVIPMLGSNDGVIPYLEVIKPIDDSSVSTYFKLLGTKRCFIETSKADERQRLLGKQNYIPAWNIKTRADLSECLLEIPTFQANNQAVAIRIADADVGSWSLVKGALRERDYLFVDLDSSSYSASLFLQLISSPLPRFNVIVISNERKTKLTGKELRKYDMKAIDGGLLNLSVIKEIKKGAFPFHGFASYCSAKNDLTEEVQQMGAVSAYGYMMVYSFDKNSFDVIVSDKQGQLHVTYAALLQKIEHNISTFVEPLFRSTPRSYDLIQKASLEGKLSCQKVITIAIVHYIEEIINALDLS